MEINANKKLLGEVLTVRAGYPFRGAIRASADGPVRVVLMGNVDQLDGIAWAAVPHTHLPPGRREPRWLHAEDIVFVHRADRYHATCIEEPPGPAVCGTSALHLRAKPEAGVLPAFVAWQMNQPPFQRELQRSAEGTAQKSIRRPVLESLPLGIPPLAAQQGIVAMARLAWRERHLHASLIRNRERMFESIAEALSGACDNEQKL